MGLHRWLMCFGQRLRGSRPRRKIGADTLKPRRALGKTWEQAPTAFEAAQLIKPPALRGVSNSLVRLNGTPANTQAWRIEGQDASNWGTPGVPAQSQPSVDAIQEVAIQTSNFAAEYGQVGGGVFNVTMKSGTNQFHGTAYEYLVN